MPELQRMPGFVGLSLLTDRGTGRCIAASAWQNDAAMRASGPLIREVRDRAVRALGGTVEVADWEIAVMHRRQESADGASVRVTWVKINPERVDSGIAAFKDGVLPVLDELEGHCGTSLLVNHLTGRAVASSAYESAEAAERHRPRLDRLRDDTAGRAGAEVLDERAFELAIAHLRVPELV
ncbi:hypothetical protein [Mycolicibacterium vaccae]|jgi:hypothetical protein|uniref:ABM domain-containing protein n=1 Tax=Mycolicibacterium vaccae ATCC 25954 TaxID=1194972 RepID=K0UY09_MYCVA|nr:hypothetical protein [Mycolicibacterium vaccae]ANI41671.1 hypothetical protein MYVA_4593 [Mycolicibacterium vaccae 95051]EJZ12002.1 hypothetical protein MVAC_03661 [Mycolicibacterium vaccae ATCC 25954]